MAAAIPKDRGQVSRFASTVLAKAAIIDEVCAENLRKALEIVPRAAFIAPRYASRAYDDCSLPIGFEQSSSAPSLIVRMLSLLAVAPGKRILEIGAGSGYALALAHAAGLKAYGIEAVGLLAQETRKRLDSLGYSTILLRSRSDLIGWAEHAPFDAILVSTPVSDLPDSLFSQLHPEGGLLVAAVGDLHGQRLQVFQRAGERFETVRFEACQIL